MKNKILKNILISVLCLILLAGCSIAPSSTPTSQGEILDLNVNLYDNASSQEVGNLDQILLEKFSLRKKYTSIENADIIFVRSSDSNIYEEYKAKYNLVNILDYVDKMLNYVKLFGGKEVFNGIFNGKTQMYTPYALSLSEYPSLWVYNKAWFAKYDYELPQTMDEMVSLLLNHKATYPDDKPILCLDSKKEGLKDGIAATFGLYTVNNEVGVTVSNGDATVNSGINHKDYIKVLDMVKAIQDNGLLYAYTSINDEAQNAAIAYTSALSLGDYSGLLNSDDWFVVPNQFSGNDNVFAVSQIGATASVSTNAFDSTQIFIQNTGNEEKIERIISYLDWLCTEDGIIATRFGLDAERDENGNLKVDSVRKNIPYARPMATEFVIDHVVAKYAPYECYEKNIYGGNGIHIFKVANAFKDSDVSILTSTNYDYKDEAYQQIAKQFYIDYMNGIKTKDDFNNYLNELKNAGLDNIVNNIKKLYR